MHLPLDIIYPSGKQIKTPDGIGWVVDHFEELRLLEVAFEKQTRLYEVSEDGAIIVPESPNSQSPNGISEPSDKDLAKITTFMPLGFTPDKTDGVVLTFVAADNMIDRSLARWNPAMLQALSKLPLGQPLILDHETEVDETQGLIFAAEVVSFKPDPYFTDCGSNKKYNRDIAAKEGYVGLLLKAFVSGSNPVLDAFKYGVGTVSLGYTFTDLFCPICGVSFYDDKCPHLIAMNDNERQEKEYAPWREKMFPSEIYELSLVVEPNLPRASILRNVHKSLINA